MTDPTELRGVISKELSRLGVPACPVVIPTPWRIGAAVSYLFPEDPVTLVDAGFGSAESARAFDEAFRRAGRRVEDLERIVVTHGHPDHLGGARSLQRRSGCEVLLHPADARGLDGVDPRATRGRELFGPLGFSDEDLGRYFPRGRPSEEEAPATTPLEDGAEYDAGTTSLRILHRPGHSAGHVWALEGRSGAVFAGDHLLADTPTNAGLEADAGHPSGRAPMLERYHAALRELRDMDVPAVFGGHGPPVTDHRGLIDRRLRKSGRRTDRVLDMLVRHGPCTAVDLAGVMFGERVSGHAYGFLADLVGRLDLLCADGRAKASRRDDGVWWFRARASGEAHEEARDR